MTSVKFESMKLDEPAKTGCPAKSKNPALYNNRRLTMTPDISKARLTV
jgi:hypothetical protein